MSFHHSLQRLPAGKHPLSVHADLLQHTAGRLAGDSVVVRHQHKEPLQPGSIRQIGLLQLQEYGGGKAGSLSWLALHLNISVHHTDDILGDGHTQSRALNLADPGVLRPGEGKEDLFHIFSGHSDSVVFKDKFIAPRSRLRYGLFRHCQRDPSSVRRILYGVSHNVHKGLLNAQTVSKHILVNDIVNTHLQFMAMLLYLGMHHGDQICKKLRKVEGLLVQAHLARLDLGHIQDLIDQPQKMPAGYGDLFQGIRHLFPVVDMAGGNGRHADDGIHGRADIMAHTGEKIRLGSIGSVGGIVGLLQGLPGKLLLPSGGGDIPADDKGVNMLRLIILKQKNTVPQITVNTLQIEFRLHIRLSPVKGLNQLIPAPQFLHSGAQRLELILPFAGFKEDVNVHRKRHSGLCQHILSGSVRNLLPQEAVGQIQAVAELAV
ncbi:hypothetical protein IMSAG185_01265 [Lachnospiraceae bacterium]|nr:hypothetical protein IMSAG185_01265 [Lachnospiraceae bacterium]